MELPKTIILRQSLSSDPRVFRLRSWMNPDGSIITTYVMDGDDGKYTVTMDRLALEDYICIK